MQLPQPSSGVGQSQQWADKHLTSSSPEGKTLVGGVCQFHGVNTFTVADFKFPTDESQSWEEVPSSEPTPGHPDQTVLE